MYRWIEHTGELTLLIEAPTEEAIFGEALPAFAELIDDDGGPDSERREVELEGDKRDVLLADWLNEFVYLVDAKQFVPEQLSELELEDGRLRATVRGRRGEPRPLVKAVSLHGLEYEEWQAPAAACRRRGAARSSCSKRPASRREPCPGRAGAVVHFRLAEALSSRS